MDKFEHSVKVNREVCFFISMHILMFILIICFFKCILSWLIKNLKMYKRKKLFNIYYCSDVLFAIIFSPILRYSFLFSSKSHLQNKCYTLAKCIKRYMYIQLYGIFFRHRTVDVLHSKRYTDVR